MVMQLLFMALQGFIQDFEKKKEKKGGGGGGGQGNSAHYHLWKSF